MDVPLVVGELGGSRVKLAITVEKMRVPYGKGDGLDGLICLESGRAGREERSWGFRCRPYGL